MTTPRLTRISMRMARRTATITRAPLQKQATRKRPAAACCSLFTATALAYDTRILLPSRVAQTKLVSYLMPWAEDGVCIQRNSGGHHAQPVGKARPHHHIWMHQGSRNGQNERATPMRKFAVLTTVLIFTAANSAFALPAAPLGGTGQGVNSGADSEILLVRNDKNNKKSKKSSKKSSGGGTNRQNMPPGHKM